MPNIIFPTHYQDVLGSILGASGGAALGTWANWSGTGCALQVFANGQDDKFLQIFQFNHDHKLDTKPGDIHIHFVPKTDPTGTQKVAFTTKWFHCPSSTAVPDIASWGSYDAQIDVTAGDVNKHCLGVLVPTAQFSQPSGEGYSSLLFALIQRNGTNDTTDTYAGDIGLLYTDCHAAVDRMGSNLTTSG